MSAMVSTSILKLFPLGPLPLVCLPLFYLWFILLSVLDRPQLFCPHPIHLVQVILERTFETLGFYGMHNFSVLFRKIGLKNCPNHCGFSFLNNCPWWLFTWQRFEEKTNSFFLKTNCVVKVLGSHCSRWTSQRRMKKLRNPSQYRIHMPSSTSSSHLLVCTRQCFWQGGQPQLGRVGSWLMWGGHPSGWGSWLVGQLQVSTSGPLWLLFCSLRGNSKPGHHQIRDKKNSAHHQCLSMLIVCNVYASTILKKEENLVLCK